MSLRQFVRNFEYCAIDVEVIYIEIWFIDIYP